MSRIINRQLDILFGVPTLVICVLVIVLMVSTGPVASSRPLTQPTPTCPAPPSGCTVARRYGYQPVPTAMVGTFDDAARNALGGNGPTYTPIARGIPTQYPGGTGITYRNVSTAEPIPSTILKAMEWWESGWRQFDGGYGANGCTYVSNTCDYGVMQLNQNSMGDMDSARIAGEYRYNIGAGTRWLIDRWSGWNYMSTPPYRLINPNNHTLADNWYYAVTAYNKWSSKNDPNSSSFSATRSPFDGTQPDPERNYPYQEIVWGYMAHPGAYGGQLWSPLRVPWVPRGIWGTGQPTDWHRPAEWTPRPMFYYLPDVRANWNGWNSDIIAQNTRGDYTLAADVAFYDTNGAFTAWWLDSQSDDWALRLPPRTRRVLSAVAACNGRKASLTCASADVGIVVHTFGPNYANRCYTAVAPQGQSTNPGWGTTGTTLYLPSLHRQPNTWHWRSTIAVQNAGAATANVTLSFYPATGGNNPLHQVTDQIPPGATHFYSTMDYSQLGGDYYGPAVVQANVPLAAVVREWNTDSPGPNLAYNGFSSGATSLYLPSQHRDSWGWTSWVHVQNPNGHPVEVRIRYYDPVTGNQKHTDSKTINANGSTYFWSGEPGYAPYLGNDYWGPAKLECGSNVVAICNEVNTGKALSYSAFTAMGTTRISLPYQKNADGWDTWTFIQNPTASPAAVTITYRDQYGSSGSSYSWPNIPAYGSVYRAASSHISGKQGSAWVECTNGQSVVAIVNLVGPTNDQAMSYNGLNR